MNLEKWISDLDSGYWGDLGEYLQTNLDARKVWLYKCAIYRKYSYYLHQVDDVEKVEAFADKGSQLPRDEDSPNYWAGWSAHYWLVNDTFNRYYTAIQLIATIANIYMDSVQMSQSRWDDTPEKLRLYSLNDHYKVLQKFLPIEWNSYWNSSNSIQIASSIYDAKDWDSCPVLADALEENGCDAEITNYLRTNKEWYLGDSVIDKARGLMHPTYF